ncbi:MAG TPA: DinB family protein, partial [Acidimicrobiales bacterium]|nr:DinB family protein [Acidimicrobiales bacterium]
MGPNLNLEGQRVDDPVFINARLHGPLFIGARLTDALFINARIEGDIEGLVINGVEVEPLVRAERERVFPELAALRATDPAGLDEGWRIVTDGWARTVARARGLSPGRLDERVDGEWSFIETQRHLIMATDIWHGRMIRGEASPYHPWGMAGSFLADPVALGLDYGARPSLDEVLAVRAS